MKKLLIMASALLGLTMAAPADIHNPPSAQYNPTRKLGRAISNILFGVIEIPEQMVRKNEQYGRKAKWSYGVVDGTRRAARRMGYGFYELVTFAWPTNRGTFKPPYRACGRDDTIEMNVDHGLSEFPPELGFDSYYSHSRTQKF